jgi:hypothetical protein
MSQADGQTTLKGLFATSAFIVPSFQRAYAWQAEPHLNDFLNDLRTHPAQGEKRYFFGTILLTKASDISSRLLNGYAVVDGQQRLTTTTIFMSLALEKLRDDRPRPELDEFYELFVRTRAGRRKFRTIVEDDPFFERLILRNGALGSCDTPSQRRLLSATQYIGKFLDGLSREEVERLLTTLAESQMLVHAVETNSEATQIFELQNDRGKRLTNLEALKSYLMHSLYLHAVGDTEADLNVVQQNFAAIYRNAENLETKYDAPEEDQLLSYHCVAFLPWITLEDGTEGWSRPKQLVRRLLAGEDKGVRSDWIKRFSSQLRDTFSSTVQILDARDSCEPLGDFTALGRTAIFWPLLLKCWQLDLDAGHSNFERAVRTMERFAFRATVAQRRADAGESYLRKWANEFTGDFSTLIDAVNRMNEWWSIPELFEFNLRVEDFYARERTATYLLWRYENYLRGQPGRQFPRLGWRTIVDPANAAVRYAKDHIEPKDEKNPVLSRLVKWDPDSDETPRLFADLYLHRLGNLVLDTVSAGAAKGNRDFTGRIEHYRASGLISQSEIVNRFATPDSDGKLKWDEAAIRRRQAALVEFALKQM